jgi:16S rRNA processing protein RimM
VSGAGDLVILARIVSPFGRRGEVKALVDTDFPEEFARRKSVILSQDGRSGADREVTGVRFHKGAALVKLRGVNSISDAEELRGWVIAIRPDQRAELDGSSFWIDDVLGLEVVTEAGQSLGGISEVLRGRANDVWVTESALIPAVKEVVVEVDLEKRRVVVRDVEGLTSGGKP